MGLFGINKKQEATYNVPVALQPENPVNYNSVLDYLVGLSPDDFKKMTKSAEIYRKADEQVAGLIGVDSEPTTSIATEKPEVSDDDLDDMLQASGIELKSAFEAEGPEAPKAKKVQSTERKVAVKD